MVERSDTYHEARTVPTPTRQESAGSRVSVMHAKLRASGSGLAGNKHQCRSIHMHIQLGVSII